MTPPTWENDRTRDMATGAIIVAAVRSGGTYLSHCLSNHPQIFCDRGEPLHYGSVWCDALQPDRRQILAALLNQTGYMVSMCRMTYMQAFHLEIWPWIRKRQPRVIWLRRENVVRQAVSLLINKAARDGQIARAQHSFDAAQPVQVELSPAAILASARGLRETDITIGERLAAIETMCAVTYADITGGEQAASAGGIPQPVGEMLCRFLGVPYVALECDLQRVNPFPLREMLTNWSAVAERIRDSEFAGMIVDE